LESYEKVGVGNDASDNVVDGTVGLIDKAGGWTGKRDSLGEGKRKERKWHRYKEPANKMMPLDPFKTLYSLPFQTS
jgi:hypothetical protein